MFLSPFLSKIKHRSGLKFFKKRVYQFLEGHVKLFNNSELLNSCKNTDIQYLTFYNSNIKPCLKKGIVLYFF